MNYWITYSDKNYMKNTDILLSLLSKLSNIKLIFFTLDFEYDNKYENVIPIYYNLNGKGIPEIKFLKAELCGKALEYDKDANFCFLDADIIPTRNCDSVFDNVYRITEYPLVTRHAHDWVRAAGIDVDNGDSPPGFLYESNLLSYIDSDISKRSLIYKQTCVVLFNYNCVDVINQWIVLCNDNFIVENKNKYAPVHEESVLNALLWKNNYNNCLSEIHMDVPDFNKFNIFNFIFNLQNLKDHSYFFGDWSRVPSKENINNICFLHGLIHNDGKSTLLHFLEKYFQNG